MEVEGESPKAAREFSTGVGVGVGVLGFLGRVDLEARTEEMVSGIPCTSSLQTLGHKGGASYLKVGC